MSYDSLDIGSLLLKLRIIAPTLFAIVKPFLFWRWRKENREKK